MAASFHHDAQAAEGEYFNGYDLALAESLDLLQRQHPGHDCTRDAEAFAVVAQGGVGGRGSLHRKMARQVGVLPGRVVEYAEVGADDGIDIEVGRPIHCFLPGADMCRAGIGIQCDVDLALARVGIADALAQIVFAEIETRERARIGLVAKADINRAGTVINSGLERGQIARRADQIHGISKRWSGGIAEFRAARRDIAQSARGLAGWTERGERVRVMGGLPPGRWRIRVTTRHRHGARCRDRR